MTHRTQTTYQPDRFRLGLKSLLGGIVATVGLLFPLGLFGSLFWNSWHQDGPPRPPPDWMQIAREAVAATLMSFLYWWWITLPVALALGYFKKAEGGT
jgi:hypothetical protein